MVTHTGVDGRSEVRVLYLLPISTGEADANFKASSSSSLDSVKVIFSTGITC